MQRDDCVAIIAEGNKLPCVQVQLDKDEDAAADESQLF